MKLECNDVQMTTRQKIHNGKKFHDSFTIYITVPLVEYYNNNHYYISVVSFSKIYLITLNETLKNPPEHY